MGFNSPRRGGGVNFPTHIGDSQGSLFAGTNIDDMKISHFMEKFLDKDFEVLYFADTVDGKRSFSPYPSKGSISIINISI